MPLSSLLASRSKTDHAKQLKECFAVIENEQDKEKKPYEEVTLLSFPLCWNCGIIIPVI